MRSGLAAAGILLLVTACAPRVEEPSPAPATAGIPAIPSESGAPLLPEEPRLYFVSSETSCKGVAFVKLDQEIVGPRRKSGVDPVMSPYLRDMHVHAGVIVDVAVNDVGHVCRVEIVESGNDEAAAATVDSVKGWVFDPAMKDGKAIAAVTRLNFRFQT